MSESDGPPPAATGARYTRSFSGLIGAMVVTVLAVLAFTAFRAITRDNESTPVRSVEYAGVVENARAQGKLLVFAPSKLPDGWRATSATYDRGMTPAWHLGLLTDEGKYVGVEEARVSIRDLVREHVDVDAEQGKDVTIAGERWQTWTDSGGDYAVARSVGGGEAPESVLVVGTAPQAQIRDFAGTLQGARERAR